MSEANKSTTTSVTMRLPDAIIEKNDFVCTALGKNKTEAVITGINLMYMVLKAQAQGKKLVIVDEVNNTKESIHFL